MRPESEKKKSRAHRVKAIGGGGRQTQSLRGNIALRSKHKTREKVEIRNTKTAARWKKVGNPK